MEDLLTYQIQIRGRVEQGELLAFVPPGLSVERVGEAATLLTLQTDQAGLIGLIRRLHGLGFVLVSITTCLEGNSDENL